MSGFLRPELAAWLTRWREPLAWGALLACGLWLIWRGYQRLEVLYFAPGLLMAATGLALLRGSLRRARLATEAAAEGIVVVDEARIGYFGPREGGFVDLPAVVRVEIVSRPHAPQSSAHAWVLTSEDGSRLVIPLGAQGADGLFDALSPLPGIDFDAGVAAIGSAGAQRAVVWKKAG